MSGATRTAITPASNANRPRIKLVGGKPEFITIHETANKKPGATAEMHRRFVHEGGGDEGVSFHYVVDDKESIQLLPDDEVAWHAGDGSNGPGNRRSIAIELCVNGDGNYAQTIRNAVTLVKRLLAEFSLPVSKVVQHNHWSGKNCPMQLRSDGWNAFVAALGASTPPQPPAQKTAIQAYWEANGGVPVFGLPLHEGERTEWIDGQQYQVRYFERARLEWAPGREVTRGLIGKELLECKGEI